MDEQFLYKDPRRKPWEQLPDETSKQFHAFVCFRDLGYTRTLLRAYRLYSGKEDAESVPSNWPHMREEFCWDERCAAYDRYMDRAKVEAQREGYAKQYHERGKTLADVELDILENAMIIGQEVREKLADERVEWLAKDVVNLVRAEVEIYSAIQKTKPKEDGTPPIETSPDEARQILKEAAELWGGLPEEQEEG